MFATAFVGLLHPVNGELLYINAGHEPAFLVSAGRLQQRLEPTGPAVGMLPNMQFKIESVTLAPGDSLPLHTDGITDALSLAEEQFAEARLIEAVTSPAPSAYRRIQYDDVTLLAVQRKSLEKL